MRTCSCCLLARSAEALGLALEPAFFHVCSTSAFAFPLHRPRATARSAMEWLTGLETTPACAHVGETAASAATGSARFSPSVEKPNLLPARPAELGACEAGAVGEFVGGGRRPADVFVPHWGLHGPAAFELAVTSGLRCGAAAASAADGSHTCAAYEERKRSHLNTAALCRDQGLQFLPLIAESSCGGWGREAIKVWRTLGALLAAKSGDGSGAATEQLLQCLSVTLQRENARAVLRRLPDGAQSASTPLQNP